MVNERCQLCGSREIKKIIDLGNHPLADSFIKEKDINKGYKVYPLQVFLCMNCGHTMLGFFVPEKERYQETEYSYTASNSPVSIMHFSEIATDIVDLVSVRKDDLVVDIGSNDGTLLNEFRKKIDCQILGIEPSYNIWKIAKNNKIPTINDFFNEKTAGFIRKKGGAKIITATNVFNHISDLKSFVKNITKSLKKDGVFVFEVPYFLTLMEKGSFDTIYLEHISYFSVKPFERFFRNNGFFIKNIKLDNYMGGSIRIYLTRNKKDLSRELNKFIEKEIKFGLYKIGVYEEFMKRINKFKINLLSEICKVKSQNKRIVGIGAATKGNTLLNYCKIDNEMIDFVTDSSELKIGKFTPGSLIPIKSDSCLGDADYGLILPWNIADFLVKKLSIHKNMKFIVPKIK